MKHALITLAATTLAAVTISCKMENPLLTESPLPYGAPQFDKIRTEHYLPAFKQAISEARDEIDAITSNPEAPTFANTIEALEFSGQRLSSVSAIFYNLLEADADEKMQAIAEKVSPLMTQYSMYVSLNEALFARIKSVWEHQESLNLEKDQLRLLEKTYREFELSGANLSAEDKKLYSEYEEQLSLLSLKFGKNALAATNAWKLELTDSSDLSGLPDYVKDMGAATAAELGKQGWVFDLSYPSYSAFMQFSDRPDLRKQCYLAYNSRAYGGENDNSEVCRQIANTRLKIANLLGFSSYAEYALKERMAKNVNAVRSLLDELMEPSLPAARQELAETLSYARSNGYTETELQPWDFSYWSEKYKSSKYDLSDELLKPYFQLDSCIDAVSDLLPDYTDSSSPLVLTFRATTRMSRYMTYAMLTASIFPFSMRTSSLAPPNAAEHG